VELSDDGTVRLGGVHARVLVDSDCDDHVPVPCRCSNPYNYKNSPYNYKNSPYNLNSSNGIYDEDGERQGYAVRRSDGGVNFFNDEGNRTGYMPGDED
jgi:hypothetical protein